MKWDPPANIFGITQKSEQSERQNLIKTRFLQLKTNLPKYKWQDHLIQTNFLQLKTNLPKYKWQDHLIKTN